MTMTHFNGKVKFGRLGFRIEKGNMLDLSETVVVYDMKVGRYIQPNEYMNLYLFQRSRPSTDLGLRALRFLQIFS